MSTFQNMGVSTLAALCQQPSVDAKNRINKGSISKSTMSTLKSYINTKQRE